MPAMAVLLVLPLLGVPSATAAPAAAGPPAAPLCAADESRGGVPERFPVEACVDGGAITVRNDRDRPVVVTGVGDLGAPVLVRSENSSVAAVVRLTAGNGRLPLLPGEVARWPIGAGATAVTVAPLPIPAAPEMAGLLRGWLAGAADEGTAAVRRSAAAEFIGQVATALLARDACSQGANFLETTACDVDAAAAIAGAASDRLVERIETAELPLLLDPATWRQWPAVDPDWPEDAAAHLAQQSVAAPVEVAPPPAAAPAGAERAVAAPAPVRTAAPHPAPAPAPVPAPAPAPAPAPEPAPAPAVAPAPAPATPHVRPSLEELYERNVQRLRELAAAWERAQQEAHERNRAGEQGNGQGQGRGQDRGRGQR